MVVWWLLCLDGCCGLVWTGCGWVWMFWDGGGLWRFTKPRWVRVGLELPPVLEAYIETLAMARCGGGW